MKLKESKSNLARLFSEENLIVEMRNVSTAYFDTENRLLVVPSLKESLSNDVVDLMISHECGHALYSPHDEWNEAINNLKINKSILNCIEDARIERMIKYKYPGLRVNYSRGYKELMEMDFFGLSKINMDELNLIDKINLQSKVGFIQGIDFDENEKYFLTKTENTKTFKDVVNLSKELQDFLKEKFQEEIEKLKEEMEEMDFDSSFDNADFGEGISVGGMATKQLNQEESDDNYGDNSDLGILPTIDEMMRSHTDEASQIQMKFLYSDSNKDSEYVDIPDVNLSDFIVDYKLLYETLSKDVPLRCIDSTKYNTFKRDNSSVVSYLVKEFLLKRNAEGRKKAKISKSGDINLSKAYAYKITDDIFKRNTVVPKHQSHGLVFFLDWSGSMQDYMEDTIKQLMCMLLFCEKLNIPYEVYAFSSQAAFHFYPEKLEEKNLNVACLQPLRLMNLFSSRMSKNEFIRASNYMMSMDRYHFSNGKDIDWDESSYIPYWFQLGNTPLNHTILFSDKILKQFKERTRVNIVNAVYLTDGESHGVRYLKRNKYGNDCMGYFRDFSTKVYIRSLKNKVTKYLDFTTSNDEQETNHCISFIKECCDFKFFAFRLVNPRELRQKLNSSGVFEDKLKVFNKENCLKYTKTTFDEFYFVRANASRNEEEMPELKEKETVANITKKFQKAVGSKVNNRVFLRKFIEFIS